MWLGTGRGTQDIVGDRRLNGMSSGQMGRSCPGNRQRKKLEEASKRDLHTDTDDWDWDVGFL